MHEEVEKDGQCSNVRDKVQIDARAFKVGSSTVVQSYMCGAERQCALCSRDGCMNCAEGWTDRIGSEYYEYE